MTQQYPNQWPQQQPAVPGHPGEYGQIQPYPQQQTSAPYGYAGQPAPQPRYTPHDNDNSLTWGQAPSFPSSPPQGLPTPSQPRSRRLRRRRYGNGRRLFYGSLWGFYTAALVIGGFAALFGGQILAGLLGVLLGAFAARYDYRIWTWQAKRLWFLIIF